MNHNSDFLTVFLLTVLSFEGSSEGMESVPSAVEIVTLKMPVMFISYLNEKHFYTVNSQSLLNHTVAVT